MIHKIFCISLLFTLIPLTRAQESDRSVFRKEKRTQRFEAGLPVFSPFAIPAYTPEMGFTIAGGGLMSFKTKRNNAYLSHSTLPLTLGVSTKGAFFGTAFLTTYWFDDRLRMYLDMWYLNREEHYWGVGIDKGLDIEQSDNTTVYERSSLRIKPSVLLRIYENFYGGILVDYNTFKAENLAPAMLEDPYVLKYGSDITSTGIGIAFNYDSRDFPPNPQEGIVLSLDILHYETALGSDYEYQVYNFDYRQYLNIIRNGSTLAWEYKIRIGTEDMPWNNMSTIGGYEDLRGYYRGQFRDRSMMFLLIEYRHKFMKTGTGELSRHGLVYWLAGGTVFDDAQSIKSPLMNTGIGYRFEVQPRMNLRIDVGFGTESSGVYFGFNEVF